MHVTYTLKVTAEGFATALREKLALQVATPETLDVTVFVAGNQESVQVVGSAAPMLNTTDATLGNTFNSQQIETPLSRGAMYGYFSLDAGLNKSFHIYDPAQLRLRWDTFNVTNSARFDPHSVRVQLDQANSFGNATGLLTEPRVMQLAARIEF